MKSQQRIISDLLKVSAIGICGVCMGALGHHPHPLPVEKYLQENVKKHFAFFNMTLQPVRSLIVELCGEQETAAMLEECCKTYEALLPQVPYIGGDENTLTDTLYLSAVALAFYKTMRSHGQPVEQSGRIIYRAIEALYDINNPLSLIRNQKPGGETPQSKYRRMARWSETSPYPGDWRLTYIESEGQEFDLGFDYSECGIVKFYKAHQAEEFTPYLCLGDFPLSKVMNSGLRRTTTLALGGACCDFRFKAGRPIQMEWTPDFLKE